MRAIWKGALAFGMVSIPVRLYSATEDRDVSFHQVHDEDAGRVRYQRMCTVCDKEVAYADLAKGFELPSGETVLLTDEDFANLPLPTTKVVELVAFVPADQVDPLALARGYYLEPDPAGRKPYELLRAALERTSRVGLAKIAVRSKESLAVLRPRGDVLALQTMVWPDEVRKAQFDVLDREVAVSDAELKMADTLIEAMSSDFTPEAYQDGYREALLSVIEAKTAGKEFVAPPTSAQPAPAVDLITALQASVEAAKAARGDPPNVPKPRKSGDKGKQASRRS
ncbi:MAG: end-binding protein Ku [Pseudonocardiales bacterium]|jgi:DNA end-binding protein Ku|nr:end-binding protein Ku [Pseudonocardiales bacterium]